MPPYVLNCVSTAGYGIMNFNHPSHVRASFQSELTAVMDAREEKVKVEILQSKREKSTDCDRFQEQTSEPLFASKDSAIIKSELCYSSTECSTESPISLTKVTVHSSRPVTTSTVTSSPLVNTVKRSTNSSNFSVDNLIGTELTISEQHHEKTSNEPDIVSHVAGIFSTADESVDYRCSGAYMQRQYHHGSCKQ